MNLFWCIILLYGLLSLFIILGGLYDRHFTTKMAWNIGFFQTGVWYTGYFFQNVYFTTKSKIFWKQCRDSCFYRKKRKQQVFNILIKNISIFFRFPFPWFLKKTSNYKLYCQRWWRKESFIYSCSKWWGFSTWKENTRSSLRFKVYFWFFCSW